MAQQGFFARWLHLLASNGAERVNVPPQASHHFREEAHAALASDKARSDDAQKNQAD